MGGKKGFGRRGEQTQRVLLRGKKLLMIESEKKRIASARVRKVQGRCKNY